MLAAGQRLCDPRQPGPLGEADDDRLCPGPQRQGHLPHRQPLRRDGQLQRARLGRQGDAAAAEPHPPAARSDGGVPDGPHHGRRDPARHRDRAARPQPAAVRQDRHDQRARPTSGSSAARPTSSPASIWATTSRGRWAAMPRAAASRRRSSSNGRRPRSRTSPRCRSSRRRASAGCASTARAASAVFGVFPTTEDPKSSVIWEAFQPQTEPRRTLRQRDRRSVQSASRSSRRSAGLAAAAAAAAAAAVAGSRLARPAAPRRGGSAAAADWLANAERALIGLFRPLDTKVLDDARRSAGPYRPDQCRDRAAAPVPRLGPRAEAARRAQRQGRGSDAVGRSQGGAGGDARAPAARRGDRRDARDRARACRHRRADRARREPKATTRWSTTASAASPSSPSAPSATRSRRCSPARPTPTTPISRSTPAPAAPRARTGPRCCSACTRAGPSATA